MRKVVGLDIPLNDPAACVLAVDATPVWQDRVDGGPGPLIDRLGPWQAGTDNVGLEACPLSGWLHRHLTEAGFNAVCMDVRQARRFLSTWPVGTDRVPDDGLAGPSRSLRAPDRREPDAAGPDGGAAPPDASGTSMSRNDARTSIEAGWTAGATKEPSTAWCRSGHRTAAAGQGG